MLVPPTWSQDTLPLCSMLISHSTTPILFRSPPSNLRSSAYVLFLGSSSSLVCCIFAAFHALSCPSVSRPLDLVLSLFSRSSHKGDSWSSYSVTFLHWCSLVLPLYDLPWHSSVQSLHLPQRPSPSLSVILTLSRRPSLLVLATFALLAAHALLVAYALLSTSSLSLSWPHSSSPTQYSHLLLHLWPTLPAALAAGPCHWKTDNDPTTVTKCYRLVTHTRTRNRTQSHSNPKAEEVTLQR